MARAAEHPEALGLDDAHLQALTEAAVAGFGFDGLEAAASAPPRAAAAAPKREADACRALAAEDARDASQLREHGLETLFGGRATIPARSTPPFPRPPRPFAEARAPRAHFHALMTLPLVYAHVGVGCSRHRVLASAKGT